ncbi:MAG: hypothetical protein AAFZ91_01615 [Pseudomonadota bacterium]
MDLDAPDLASDLLRLDILNETHREILRTSDIETALWLWMPAIPGGTHFNNYFDYMLKMQASGLTVLYVVLRKSDDRFMGLTGFGEINRLHRRLRNLLAWYPPDVFEPRLYASSQLAMLRRAQDWGAKRIEWQVNTKNTFVLEQLEIIAPTREALLRNYERAADGEWTDKIVFSLIRDEIEAAAQRLETLLAER